MRTKLLWSTVLFGWIVSSTISPSEATANAPRSTAERAKHAGQKEDSDDEDARAYVGWIEVVVTSGEKPVVGAHVIPAFKQSMPMTAEMTGLRNFWVQESGADTGPEGTARVRSRGGRFQLCVTSRGLAPATVEADHDPRQAVLKMRVELNEGAPLVGRLLDNDSAQGIEGLKVRVSKGNEGYEATSKSDGTFRIEHLASGRYSIVAGGPSHEMQFFREVQVPGNASLVIKLRPKGRIMGQVIDAKRRPVSGAKIDAQEYVKSSTARSDAKGQFSILVDPGVYVLTASRHHQAGYYNGRISVPSGSKVEGIMVQLAPTGFVRGEVKSRSTNKAVSALVSLTHEDSGRSFDVRTDATGKYAAEDLLPGKYKITVISTPYAPQESSGVAVRPFARTAWRM